MGSLPGSGFVAPKLHEATCATTVLLPTRMSNFLEVQVLSWFTLGRYRKTWICWWILLFCAILGSSLSYCFRVGPAKKHPCDALLFCFSKRRGDTSQYHTKNAWNIPALRSLAKSMRENYKQDLHTAKFNQISSGQHMTHREGCITTWRLTRCLVGNQSAPPFKNNEDVEDSEV